MFELGNSLLFLLFMYTIFESEMKKIEKKNKKNGAVVMVDHHTAVRLQAPRPSNKLPYGSMWELRKLESASSRPPNRL